MSEEIKNVMPPSNDAYVNDSYNQIMKGRLDKIKALNDEGKLAYNNDGFMPDAHAADLKNRYASLSREELEALDVHCKLAGRLMSMRIMGKCSFAHIKDQTGAIQLFVARNTIGDDEYKVYKKFDIGDILAAEGTLFITEKGDLALRVTTVRLLTKSLRPLPEKFHGLNDQELRYRQRYLDLIVNDDVRDTFYKRSLITQKIREFMVRNRFLEVETPMLQIQAGGATARPFKTHHNALDHDMFLRIAPELFLKRLVVGGFERVFEMNRCFRNEGLDRKHNPEFTTIEFYMAYGTYRVLMEFTEQLVQYLCDEVCGTRKIQYNGSEINFDGSWRRLRVREGVANALAVDEAKLSDRSFLEDVVRHLPEPISEADLPHKSDGHLIMEIFDQKVEETLVQPTFVYEYPASVSPLSRRNEHDPDYVDRFEIFVCGFELGNAFNELNDALDQRQRFLDQIQKKIEGDDEAHPMDDDYVRALEFGMPPCAGEGIGVDRLCMLLTGAESIRDVILFPTMKPE